MQAFPPFDVPPAFDEPPFPDTAGPRHPSEPPAEASTAGVSRPDGEALAAEAPCEGRADESARPSHPHFLSAPLTVSDLTDKGIPASLAPDGGVQLTLGDGLVALYIPLNRPDWHMDAIEVTGARDVLKSIEWMERTDSMNLLVMRMAHPELLAAHATVRDGVTVAELRTTGTVALANLVRGRGQVTTLSAADEMLLGDLLDWASEQSTAPLIQAVDLRQLSPEAARVRLAYNADHPATVLRDGKVYRSFDLLDNDPEKAASKLVKDGSLRIRPPHLRSSTITKVTVDGAVDDVVRSIVEVLVNAVQEADATFPLVLVEPGTGGAAGRLVSITPGGEVVRWDTAMELQTLVLLAVQPMRRTQDALRYDNGVPGTLLGRIALELRASAHELTNVVFEPTLIGNDIIDTPGYHRAARAVLVMPHRDRRRWADEYKVPARPSVEEAQAAFELLDTELCSSFPWAEDRDRARYMAMLLTGVARAAVDVSPGFALDANEIGTGKSAAAEAARTLSQGSKVAVPWSLGRGADEESAKALAGAMMTKNTRWFHNDEVRGPINSPFVGKIITAGDDVESIRELGVNRLVTVRGIVVTACGNNITVKDDNARRWLRIRLEKPLLQMATGGKYRHSDLYAYIRQNRPALVAAAHTLVLRAVQQGPAYPVSTLQFRPSWSRRILGALTWVKVDGETVASRVIRGWDEDVAGADHHAEAWGEALVYTWRYLTHPVSASEFAQVTLTCKGELGLGDELLAAGRRQLGARWSVALKSMRNRKVVFGDRVYRVTAEKNDGRWLFDIEAFDLTALIEHREERLTRPPLTDIEANLFRAAMAGASNF